jgi:hypothetical protein
MLFEGIFLVAVTRTAAPPGRTRFTGNRPVTDRSAPPIAGGPLTWGRGPFRLVTIIQSTSRNTAELPP